MDINQHLIVAVSGEIPSDETKAELEKYLSDFGSTSDVRVIVTIDEFKAVKFNFTFTDNEEHDNIVNGEEFVNNIKGANLLLLNKDSLPNAVHQIAYSCAARMQNESAEKVLNNNVDDTHAVFCGITTAHYDETGKLIRFANVI